MPLQDEFQSVGQADTTFYNWLEQNRQGDDDGGGDGGDDGPPSNVWSGSLDLPNEVRSQTSFTAEAEVRNTADSRVDSRFILMIEVEGQRYQMGSASTSAQAGGSSTLSFEVAGENFGVSAGDYPVMLAAVSPDAAAGIVADQSLTVTAADGSDGDGDGGGQWGEAQLVQELNYGWYLFAQEHTQQDSRRFMVAGKRSDGTMIYILPQGQTREEEPHFFDTADAALSAYERWVQRHQNDETSDDGTPSESAPRPESGEVTQDARDATSRVTGAITGVLDTVMSNPLLMAAAVVGAGLGYWYYKQYDGELVWPAVGDLTEDIEEALNGGGS